MKKVVRVLNVLIRQLSSQKSLLNRILGGGLLLSFLGNIDPVFSQPLPDPNLNFYPPQNSVQPVISSGNMNRPILKLGSQGETVMELQVILKLLGFYRGMIDGIYSQEMSRSVSLFQQIAGLNASGEVETTTWERLLPSLNTPNCPCQQFPVYLGGSASFPPFPQGTLIGNNTGYLSSGMSILTAPNSLPILKLGMRGNLVELLQDRLQSKGYLQGRKDGVFGRQTQLGVKKIQRQYRLVPDGVVGPETWELLLRN